MGLAISVEIGDHRLRRSEVERLRVRQAIGDHDRCDLRFFRDPGVGWGSSDLRSLLGAPVRVRLVDESGAVEVFAGEVVHAEEEHLVQGTASVRVRAVGPSGHLGDRHRSVYHAQRTLADLARAMGVAVSGELPAAEPLDLVQTAESDWAFLLRLADEHGWMLRATAEGAELRHGFAPTLHMLNWGTKLLRLRIGARQVAASFAGAAYEVAGKHDHRFRGIVREPELLDASAADLTRAIARSARGPDDTRVLNTPDRAPTMARAQAVLARESTRALGAAVRVRGESIHPAVAAGDRIRIESPGEHWRLPVEGEFGLVRVEHLWDGQQYRNRFEATVWAGYTAARRPRRRPAPGLMVALVVANDDPQGIGRVRVRFPWQDSDTRTGWVRTVAPYAGNGRGIAFLPEPGDEVLLGFEDGDPERAYVVGSLWNGKDRAPEGMATVKRIVTRSGNAVVLSDQEGEETVEIHSAGGKCLVRLGNGSTPTLTVHSEGDLVLEAKGELRLRAARLSQQVDGDSVRRTGGSEHATLGGALEISAAEDVAIAAGANAALQAGANLETVAGGQHSIRGAMVQLQPPGFRARRVAPAPTPAHTLLAATRALPTLAPGRSTGDAPRRGHSTRVAQPSRSFALGQGPAEDGE